MPIHNLATCFAPTMMKPDNTSFMIEETGSANNVLTTLLTNTTMLFQYVAQEYIGVAKSLYEYSSSQPGFGYELEFKKGDIIFILKEDDNGWWTGDANGMVGIFPYNYVELLMMFGSESGRSSLDMESKRSNNNTIGTKKQPQQTVPPEEWIALKQMYEEEKSKRIELEELAKSLVEVVTSMKAEVATMKENNEKLANR